MLKYISAGFLLIALISCQANDSELDQDTSGIPLDVGEEVGIKNIIELNHEESGIYSPLDMAVDSTGRILVVDHSNWTIHLLSKEGDSITEAGGYGRGPGEFEVINQLVIDSGQKLKVLDKRLNRVSNFEIKENELNYLKSISLPDYSGYSLESLHCMESQGMVGVFKPVTTQHDETTNFDVFHLTEDYQIAEQIMELPGNEKMMLGNYTEDHIFGDKTEWKTHQDQFYYARSDGFSFTAYHIADNTEHEYSIPGVTENKMTLETSEFLKNHLRPLIRSYPDVEDVIDERQILPQFLSFDVGSSFGYFTLFNMSNHPGSIVMLNKETGDVKTVEVPPLFNLYAVYEGENEHRLYGIDHTDGRDKMMIFQI